MSASDQVLGYIQTSPRSLVEIIQETGYSDRQVRRILAGPDIIKQRNGKHVLYSADSSIKVKQSVKSIPLSNKVKEPPAIETDDPHKCQKGYEDCQNEPGSLHKCRSCPLSYAELERDTIQFVIVDREFRDLLIQQAAVRKWERKINTHGLTWVYPYRDLALQVGGDVVVWYSREPKDLEHIIDWVTKNFTGIYSDIDNLVKRIRIPQELTRDELTVVITDIPTMEAMRPTITRKSDKTGTFFLKSPNSNVPGFKAYFSKGTLRCEFDCRDEVRKISGLAMRRRLMEIIPGIANAPGLFDEFLTDYYNPYEHPIMIDTGGHEFREALVEITRMFTETLKEIITSRTMEPATQELPVGKDLKKLEQKIEKQSEFDIEEILKTFVQTLKVERESVRVYLAAWTVWASRNCRGRVLKEDVASVLLKTEEPLTLDRIAAAIEQLQGAGLMKRDANLDIKFSPAGIALAKKLVAKREGIV